MICLSGETGIRTALKMLRPMSCRFESDLRHQFSLTWTYFKNIFQNMNIPNKYRILFGIFFCVEHGMNSVGDNPTTGIYRQV